VTLFFFLRHFSKNVMIIIKNEYYNYKEVNMKKKVNHKVFFPIGISGAGKSTLYFSKYSFCILIEPDQIRKEYLGDVNDQTRNGCVFDLTHHKLLEIMSYGVDDIYLSETHLWLEGLKDEIQMVLSYGYEPVFILFDNASRNPSLCRERVRNAISRGDDRCNTVDVTIRVNDEEKSLIDSMSERYIQMVDSDDFKNFVYGYKVIRI